MRASTHSLQRRRLASGLLLAILMLSTGLAGSFPMLAAKLAALDRPAAGIQIAGPGEPGGTGG